MGVITISLKEQDENNIRRLAREMYGMKKGAISLTIANAVQQNLEVMEQKILRERAIKYLEKARILGKKNWTKRDELYD